MLQPSILIIDDQKLNALLVSHELRSPLTRSKLALEFLPEVPARESIREDLAEMETMLGEILETERLHSPHGGQPKRLGAIDPSDPSDTSDASTSNPRSFL